MITDVPGASPVTIPDEEPTPAIDVDPDVQTPPVGEPVRLMLEPTHTTPGPVMTGLGLTLTKDVAKQPVGSIYVITAVPAAIPVTTPDDEPTIAIVVLPLVHNPPAGVAVIINDPPTHMCAPVDKPMTGTGFTVIVVVT